MKSLLIKDLLNLKGQAKAYLLVLAFYVIFSFTQGDFSFFIGMLVFLSVFLVINTLSFDEKAKWDKYALTMPISRKSIVIEKYLLGFSLIFIGLGISVALLLFVDKSDRLETIFTAGIVSALGILFLSLVLPIIFKFGVEKGRLLMLIVFFIPTMLITLLPSLGVPMPNEKILLNIAYASPFILTIVFIFSLFISLKIYNKKDI